MTHTRHDILEKIIEIIDSAVQTGVDEIGPERALVADLGVGSLDMATIVFEIEEAFGVEIETDVLFPHRLLRDPQLVKDGLVTAAGVEKLKEQFHFSSLDHIAPGSPSAMVADRLITVGLLTDYVDYLVRNR